jgi:hypothetical protein
MSRVKESIQSGRHTPDREGGTPPVEPACRLASMALAVAGEVRCPVCHQIVPPEQIGYKLHCRRCGYLESCCNPF